MDYRAAGAASYLGLGATWALGLSSSAAMLMATKSCDSARVAGGFRGYPNPSDVVPVAEHGHGVGGDRGVGDGGVLFGAVGREGANR